MMRSLLPLSGLGLCFAACMAPAVEPAQSEPYARDAIDAANSAILQGDARRAIAVLSTAAPDGFRGPQRDQRACMLGRLDRARPPFLADGIDDPFVRNVLAAYQDYWWHALATPRQRAALDEQLLARLHNMMAQAGIAHDRSGDFDATETQLTAALGERRYHAQMGRTPPLRELMLWRTQGTREFDVPLPEGEQRVKVELLDDFVALGWSAYGRCDHGSNGGWATAEKLFAIVPVYGDLEAEKFRVVFLGHEAQHFADQNRFPGLEPWELEYRAKLVELAQADAVSAKRLRGFITAQSDDPDSPHTYANKRVVEHLRAKLDAEPDQAPLAHLQATARELLLEDSARREGGATH
ncbi:hypothetical protein [Luteimonas salinilitoris]|uniref:Uncharacterized protein n=1 Tax=Luteimonas salinilitoris TaxID=3237697 RepID=A0ABV4HU53_9GAMM